MVRAVPPLRHHPGRRPPLNRRRLYLRHHLRGDQLQVVQVGQVEHLQVHPFGADRGELGDLVHDLARRPATPISRRSSGSRPIAAARRRNSASSFPQHTVWATEYVMDAGCARPPRRPRGPARTRPPSPGGWGTPRCTRRRTWRPAAACGAARAADQNRRARALGRLRQRGRVRQLVVRARRRRTSGPSGVPTGR